MRTLFGLVCSLMFVFTGFAPLLNLSKHSAHTYEELPEFFMSGDFLCMDTGSLDGGIGALGGGGIGYTPVQIQETIYYYTRTQTSFRNNRLQGLSHQYCGLTSGMDTFGWHNRFVPNLIPGHDAGFYFMGVWIWRGATPALSAFATQLRVDLGIGASGGVTVPGYLNGMHVMANRQGRTFTHNNVWQGSNNLRPDFRQHLREGRLLNLFMQTYNTTSHPENLFRPSTPGVHNISLVFWTGNHMMVAYGYRDIFYFDENGNLIQHDLWLYVNHGHGLGMTLISRHTNVSNAFSVRIA